MARRATSTKRTPRRASKDAAANPPAEKRLLPQPAGTTTEAPLEQLLTFLIGDDEYGISILRVREIAEYRTLTPVPMTAAWMRGVMNLRGTVVPVVDLAARLGMEPTTVSRRTCLIIVEMDADGERVVIAVMVDAVSRVVDVSQADIQEPPPFGLGIDFVPGLVRVDERLIVLLDLAAILSSTDIMDAATLLPTLRDQAAGGTDAHQ
ncbi:MAG TPA: chemotaxis protein CheW [Thermoanaerobaculia bacterium]|nr:chemotaxis protein CheW [Thermoanaerobaculia bacterium]